MDPINIVYVLSTLEIGGTETQMLEMLRRLDRARFAPQVLAFPVDGPLRPALQNLSVPVTGLGFSGDLGRRHLCSYWRLFRLLLRMVRYFRQERPAIVQSYVFWPNIWGTLAAKAAGVPVILTGRREMLKRQHRRFPDLWLQNLSNRWATGIVANAEILRQQCLIEEKHVAAERIHLVYNGVAAPDILDQAATDALKAIWRIPPDAAVVGLVANLRPVKGPDMFFQAAARVLQVRPHTVFVVVGRYESMRGEIERLLAETGLAHAIRLTGHQPDVAAWLTMFDVQVCASSEEGLSNAVLEGMRAGKPIVATRVGGNCELVVENQTGLLVPPDNVEQLAGGILTVLADSELRSAMGQAGRQRAETVFGMERLMRETETLYEHLLHDVCRHANRKLLRI